jgi:ElaB/YqjD/DUF883 family membrane-anchored ribosome-binding protein
MDYALATKPGAIGYDIVNTVRANPIPIAMIGIGIAWLIASKRSGAAYGSTRYPRRTRSSVIYTPEDDYPYGPLYGVGYPADQDAASSNTGVLHRAAAATSETGRAMRDKASELGERISDQASVLGERAQHLGQTAQTRLHESASTARARMNEMGQRSQEQYYRAKDQVSHFVDEQPLVVAALGLAIGAALGAALPTTRRENELLGRTRDDLLGRAKETALEQVETVKQSAQRFADAATDVVKQEASRVKEDVLGTGAQGREQSSSSSLKPTPASTSGMDLSQYGGISGQQRPH